jgi:PD-(D/E)XK nuclease superfamily protein
MAARFAHGIGEIMVAEVALYRNAKGNLVTHGSYSARETYRYCPRKFKLSRVDGWKSIEQRASALFGRCNEAAHQWFEECHREPGSGVVKFTQLWQQVAEGPDFSKLTYTESEVSWSGLMRAGQEMQKLYEIAAPKLPISVDPKPRFQVPLRKKIFPGTELDVLENVAYIDILSFPRWDHPALAPIADPNVIGGMIHRPLIIDAKTSGVDLNTALIPLDPQLAEYSWQSRIPDVAFLWFVKHGHDIERRSRVTLLERVEGIAAGTELFVLGYDKPEKTKVKKGEDVPSPFVPVSNEIIRVYLGDAKAVNLYYDHVRGLSANSAAYKEAAHTFFQARFVISCQPNQITKQRLQFVAARLDEETINEVGRGVGQDTVEMVRAHNENFYRKTGGVRFPNNKCNFCEMRGICSGDAELRDSLLTRSGEEWFSGAEED